MSMNKQDLERGLAAYKQEKKRSTLKFVLLAAVGICAFLLIWQLIVQFKLVNVRSLPSPVKVLQTLIKKISTKNPDGNTLGTNILASLQVSLTGFALALVIGVPELLGLLGLPSAYTEQIQNILYSLLLIIIIIKRPQGLFGKLKY